MSTHCMVWDDQERQDLHKLWMKKCFTHTEKRQSRVTFSSEGQSPKASGSPPAMFSGWWSACTPLMLQAKDLVPAICHRTDVVLGLARCHMKQALKTNMRAQLGSRTEKAISTLGGKPSSDYKGSLSLGREVFQAQSPFFGSHLGCQKTAFPNKDRLLFSKVINKIKFSQGHVQSCYSRASFLRANHFKDGIDFQRFLLLDFAYAIMLNCFLYIHNFNLFPNKFP